MTFLDIAKIALTIIGSIGGAGAIIVGLSGFLGKLWADRALEKQRHEYAQLTQQAQHQLDVALKRVQMELDKLGLMHSLRTKEEFNRLAGLWKRFAVLTDAFAAISVPEPSFVLALEEERSKLKAKQREEFSSALYGARQFLYEVMVFIPEPIAMVATETLSPAIKVSCLNTDQIRSKQSAESYTEMTQRALDEFYSGRNHLEQLIRKHMRGESLGVTERPD